MAVIYEQPPSGGCECCGGPVRTRKAEGWMCSKCVKAGLYRLEGGLTWLRLQAGT